MVLVWYNDDGEEELSNDRVLNNMKPQLIRNNWNDSDLSYSAFSIKINTNILISIFAYGGDILCYIKYMINSMYTLLAGLLLDLEEGKCNTERRSLSLR